MVIRQLSNSFLGKNMSKRNENRAGYKKTKVGWVPEEWEAKKFVDICKVNQGLQIPVSSRFAEPGENKLVYITIQYLNGNSKTEYIESANKSVICSGKDVLMTRTGNTGYIVTNVAGVFHNNFFKIKYKENIIDNNFLVSLLNSDFIQYRIKVLAGSSTIPDLNHGDFYNIAIPLPPIVEQQKIAKILSAWDRAIEQTKKLIAAKQKLKKGLMQQLLTGRMRFPEFGKPAKKKSELPEGWKTARIQDFVTIIYGKDWKTVASTKPLFPVYGTGGIIGYAKKPLFNGPSILLGRKGTINKPIFITEPFWAIDTTFYTTVINGVIPLYLYYLFCTTNWSKYNEASGVPSLSRQTILQIKLLLPAASEQQRIASTVNSFDKQIKLLQKKEVTLQEQKKGLIQKLLTGEIRVKTK
jgi:type I restriction enzyme, S subunit